MYRTIALAAGALMSYGIWLASRPAGFFFAGTFVLVMMFISIHSDFELQQIRKELRKK
jgi:hypothetical protein